ncbi:hypothetical protein NEFER03_0853 [Nematocida sp. LUAm3]|nr:hypothetical protein NEFER03_0853 [Nematocida sp. LUAm3]KAI5174871.1 hypothetical protein NEFER02_0971 [Nematocida sp. LUAm2]KAI5177531.1 hypothetical protein NEFER01_0781 [Nematocida sp. LUAm1]
MRDIMGIVGSSILCVKSSFLLERENKEFSLFYEEEGDSLFLRVKKSFSRVCAVEIVGGRKTGKSEFLLKFLIKNNQLFPYLLITKGGLPFVNCPVKAVHTVDSFISSVYSVISNIPNYPTDILCIDSLSTILYTQEGMKRKKEVYVVLKQALAVGIRILCISSIIEPTPKTSSFFDESIDVK